MKKMLCLLAALCALMLLCAASKSGFALDPGRINEAAASVVILDQKDEEGNVIAHASGFAAIEPGLVITSASFIADAEEIIVTTDGGETLSVSGILGCNTDNDITIIALEEKDKLELLPIDVEKRVLRGSDSACGLEGRKYRKRRNQFRFVRAFLYASELRRFFHQRGLSVSRRRSRLGQGKKYRRMALQEFLHGGRGNRR